MGWMAPLRHLSAKLLCKRISSEREPSMGEITTIGLDLAKHVFQVHGIDADGRRFCVNSCGAAKCWRSSAGCRAVWWDWRLVRRPTTGLESWARLATRCD